MVLDTKAPLREIIERYMRSTIHNLWQEKTQYLQVGFTIILGGNYNTPQGGKLKDQDNDNRFCTRFNI